MLLLIIAVWFILTIPVGIVVGRGIAARRSSGNSSFESAAKSGRQVVKTKLGKSA